MLQSTRIPTPLIRPEERVPIVIDELETGLRFRDLFTLQQMFLLISRLVWMKFTRQSSSRTFGIVLRNFCQKMGVLWIKVGQLLALRIDLFSLEMCDELSTLQDQAHGFSPTRSKQILEAELGAPVEELFSPFIEMPFAAASISQVHKAFLTREQIWVAIKVRKPNARKMFFKDMAMIRRIIAIIEWCGFQPFMRWQDLGWEIEQLMLEELDYRYEAANMRRMKKSLRRHHIYVPKVFRRYSTPSVLTMEFVSGVLMADYLKIARTDPARLQAWRKTNKINPDVLGKRLFYSNLRQLFEDNVFHGDLHPGNIVLLRNSRAAFIDFGSISFSDRAFLKKYSIYLEALTGQQYAKAFDVYLMFSESIPADGLATLKDQFIELLRSWQERCRIKALSYDERAVSALGDTLVRLFGRYQVGLPWTFLRFMRVSATLDVSLRELIPQQDVNRLLIRYFRQRERRVMQHVVRHPNPELFNLPAIVETPIRLNEAMFFRGAIIRRMAQVFEGMISRVSHVFDTLFTLTLFTMRMVILLLGLVCAEHYQIAWVSSRLPETLAKMAQLIPPLDLQVWGLVFFGLLYIERALAKLRRHFSKTESKRVGR